MTDTSSNIDNEISTFQHTYNSRSDRWRDRTGLNTCSGTIYVYTLPHYCISLIHHPNFLNLCCYYWCQVV